MMLHNLFLSLFLASTTIMTEAAPLVPKPEAAPKAEADPYLLYGGVYGLGYRGYGYGLHHGLYYGKREAEAAPKAEADPYLLYGGYGLGYGHVGYGYGLGYRGYYWG